MPACPRGLRNLRSHDRVHTLWCFVKETSWKQTRQTGAGTSASPPRLEPSKISRQMLNSGGGGGLLRQLLHAFL